MFNVNIHVDGSCSGNPGPGGYGAILTYKDLEKVVRGYEQDSTNNRAELLAVIAGLKALTKPCNVTVSTNSNYLLNCATHDKNWLLVTNRKNHDLWVQYVNASKTHKVTFIKVEGPSDKVYNERCSKVAKEQTRKCIHLMFGRGV